MNLQNVGLFVVRYEHQPGFTSYHKFTADELADAINKYKEVKADFQINPEAVEYGVYVVPKREKPLEFGEDPGSFEIGEGIYDYCYGGEERPVKTAKPIESEQMSLF